MIFGKTEHSNLHYDPPNILEKCNINVINQDMSQVLKSCQRNCSTVFAHCITGILDMISRSAETDTMFK